MNTETDSNVSDDRKNKIENMLKFVNISTTLNIYKFYRLIYDHLFEQLNIMPPMDLNECDSKYICDDLHVNVLCSDEHYSIVSVYIEGGREGYTYYSGFVVDNIFYYEGSKCHQRSFTIVDGKLTLGDITEIKYESLINLLYELYDVDELIQNCIVDAELKKYIPENRDVILIFSNDVSINISEVLLSIYSPVYNMLLSRDLQFLSPTQSKDNLKGIWHVPGSPTLRVVQLIKDQITSGRTKIKETLSFDDLNSYIEIFQYLGLNHTQH